MRKTHLRSWRRKMKIQLMYSSSRQEVSTKKGTCYFTPEFCSSRPRRHSQLENRNLVPPHPDYYSIVSLFFHFPLPHSFIVHKVTGVCAQTYCFFLKNEIASGMFWSTSNGDGLGKITDSVKIPSFLISGTLISSYFFYSSKLFCSHCLTKKEQHKNSCIPCLIGKF